MLKRGLLVSTVATGTDFHALTDLYDLFAQHNTVVQMSFILLRLALNSRT